MWTSAHDEKEEAEEQYTQSRGDLRLKWTSVTKHEKDAKRHQRGALGEKLGNERYILGSPKKVPRREIDGPVNSHFERGEKASQESSRQSAHVCSASSKMCLYNSLDMGLTPPGFVV